MVELRMALPSASCCLAAVAMLRRVRRNREILRAPRTCMDGAAARVAACWMASCGAKPIAKEVVANIFCMRKLNREKSPGWAVGPTRPR